MRGMVFVDYETLQLAATIIMKITHAVVERFLQTVDVGKNRSRSYVKHISQPIA